MNRKIQGQFVGFVSGAVFCLACASVAFAQQTATQAESRGDQLQEILVTAQKRISTVQDTPISITAVTGQDLLDRGITDITSSASSTATRGRKRNISLTTRGNRSRIGSISEASTFSIIWTLPI